MSDKPTTTPATAAAPAADTKPAETTTTEASPEAAATETTPSEATPTSAPATTEAATIKADTPSESEVAAEAAATTPVKATEPTEAAKATTELETAAATTKDAPTAAEEAKVMPIQALYAAAKENGHPEIWGVTLADPASDVPSQIVFQKYLNANDGNLAKAKDQLLKTLDWRAKVKPLELLKQKHSSDKFVGMGYVTQYTVGETYDPAEPETKEVFTWNIYGSVKNVNNTFGDLNEFIEWRVALMEMGLQDLAIATATKPITEDDDPYKMYQVHDYKSMTFLRQPAVVKTASSETIKVFAQNYPELVKEKFFVNVPAVMGFLYAFMKLFVAPKTIKKFHPMANGSGLVHELVNSKIQNLGERLPTEYGGKAGELKTLGREPELQVLAELVEPAETKPSNVATPAKEELPAKNEVPVKEDTTAKEDTPATPAKEEAAPTETASAEATPKEETKA